MNRKFVNLDIDVKSIESFGSKEVRDAYQYQAGNYMFPQTAQGVSVLINYYEEIPNYFVPNKRPSVEQTKRMIVGAESPQIKPNIDNIAKTIIEALTGLAYRDAAEVTSLFVFKDWSVKPGIKITMRADLEEGGSDVCRN